MENDINTIKVKSAKVFALYPIKRAYLFGSYLRGDYTAGSDIDIVFDTEKGATLTFRELNELYNKLEAEFGRKIDLVSRRKIRPALKPYIINEMQPIYEKVG